MDETLKKKWREKYHEVKHQEWYVKARKQRAKRFNLRHPFKKLVKSLRKKVPDSSITELDLWKLAKRQRCVCPLTGRTLTTTNISVDHIQHKSKGGLCHIDNVRLVVIEANLARHVLSDKEFLQLCSDVVTRNILRVA